MRGHTARSLPQEIAQKISQKNLTLVIKRSTVSKPRRLSEDVHAYQSKLREASSSVPGGPRRHSTRIVSESIVK